MGEYHEVSYWDARYVVDVEPFEWYQSYGALRAFIAPLLHSHPTQPQPSLLRTPSAGRGRRASILLQQQAASSSAASASPLVPNRRASLISAVPSSPFLPPRASILLLSSSPVLTAFAGSSRGLPQSYDVGAVVGGFSPPSAAAAPPAASPPTAQPLPPTASPGSPLQALVRRALKLHRRTGSEGQADVTAATSVLPPSGTVVTEAAAAPALPSSPPAERPRVLILGCGMSEVGVEVWRSSECRAVVVSVDFSVQCIEECRRRYAGCEGMKWEVADVRRLDFPADSFDLIIDKATLDCLHCEDRDGWQEELKKTVAGLQRLLRVKGALLSLSHSPPDQRLPYLLLHQVDVWKDAIETEKKEKARRASILPSLSADGSARPSPAMASRRASVSMSQAALLLPSAAFTQPIVHRLRKPTAPSRTRSRSRSRRDRPEDDAVEEREHRGRRRSSSTRWEEKRSGGESSEDADSEQDVEAALNMSSMEEAEHYLYVLRKEMADAPAHSTPHMGRQQSIVAGRLTDERPFADSREGVE